MVTGYGYYRCGSGGDRRTGRPAALGRPGGGAPTLGRVATQEIVQSFCVRQLGAAGGPRCRGIRARLAAAAGHRRHDRVRGHDRAQRGHPGRPGLGHRHRPARARPAQGHRGRPGTSTVRGRSHSACSCSSASGSALTTLRGGTARWSGALALVVWRRDAVPGRHRLGGRHARGPAPVRAAAVTVGGQRRVAGRRDPGPLVPGHAPHLGAAAGPDHAAADGGPQPPAAAVPGLAGRGLPVRRRHSRH